VEGFGADFFDVLNASLLTVTANFAGGGSETVLFSDHLAAPGTGFLGVVSTSPIASLLWSTELPTGEMWAVDNFSFAIAAVPLPATLALLGLGLLGLGFSRRRSKNS
jgi:PEP-CTERM motif